MFLWLIHDILFEGKTKGSLGALSFCSCQTKIYGFSDTLSGMAWRSKLPHVVDLQCSYMLRVPKCKKWWLSEGHIKNEVFIDTNRVMDLFSNSFWSCNKEVQETLIHKKYVALERSTDAWLQHPKYLRVGPKL